MEAGTVPRTGEGEGTDPRTGSMWMGLDAASSWSNLSFQPARVPSIFVFSMDGSSALSFLDGWSAEECARV